MVRTKQLFLLILIVAVVALAAVGLRGLLTTAAWAQAGAADPHAGHGHAEGEHEEAAQGSQGPPLPNLEEALKQAASADLAAQQQGMTALATLYQASTDEAVLRKVETVLREAATKGKTAGLRQVGISGLGTRADRNGPLLLAATFDRDPEVQVAAINALTLAPASAEVDSRLQQLMGSADPGLAAASVTALMTRLGNLGAAGAPRLAAWLGTERGDANGVAALQLIRVGREAVPTLMATLAGSPNATARHGAAVVLTILCGGKSERQEAFLKAGQAEWKFPTPLPEPDKRPLAVLIDRLLNDSDALVREACAEALSLIGDPAAARALAQALASDPADEVRAYAAAALMMIPGNEALPALVQAVEGDKSARVRRFAAEALGWMGETRAPDALIRATQDPDPEVRRLAAVQLGRLKSEQALQALTDLFDDPSEDVRWAAVRAVDGLRNRAAVPALVRAAQDPSVLVSHAAETALQKLGEVRRGSDVNLKQKSQG